jgi:hypothetical protein
VELDLGDRGADRGRERIAADHDHAAERRRAEQERREQARGLVGAEVLDVVDHEHARLLRERLRERARHAAERTLGARAQRRRAIAWMTVDDRARPAQPGSELADEPRLPGAQRTVERHQGHHGEVLLELGQLALPTDERDRANGCHRVRDLRGTTPHEVVSGMEQGLSQRAPAIRASGIPTQPGERTRPL